MERWPARRWRSTRRRRRLAGRAAAQGNPGVERTEGSAPPTWRTAPRRAPAPARRPGTGAPTRAARSAGRGRGHRPCGPSAPRTTRPRGHGEDAVADAERRRARALHIACERPAREVGIEGDRASHAHHVERVLRERLLHRADRPESARHHERQPRHPAHTARELEEVGHPRDRAPADAGAEQQRRRLVGPPGDLEEVPPPRRASRRPGARRPPRSRPAGSRRS